MKAHVRLVKFCSWVYRGGAKNWGPSVATKKAVLKELLKSLEIHRRRLPCEKSPSQPFTSQKIEKTTFFAFLETAAQAPVELANR